MEDVAEHVHLLRTAVGSPQEFTALVQPGYLPISLLWDAVTSSAVGLLNSSQVAALWQGVLHAVARAAEKAPSGHVIAPLLLDVLCELAISGHVLPKVQSPDTGAAQPTSSELGLAAVCAAWDRLVAETAAGEARIAIQLHCLLNKEQVPDPLPQPEFDHEERTALASVQVIRTAILQLADTKKSLPLGARVSTPTDQHSLASTVMRLTAKLLRGATAAILVRDAAVAELVEAAQAEESARRGASSGTAAGGASSSKKRKSGKKAQGKEKKDASADEASDADGAVGPATSSTSSNGSSSGSLAELNKLRKHVLCYGVQASNKPSVPVSGSVSQALPLDTLHFGRVSTAASQLFSVMAGTTDCGPGLDTVVNRLRSVAADWTAYASASCADATIQRLQLISSCEPVGSVGKTKVPALTVAVLPPPADSSTGAVSRGGAAAAAVAERCSLVEELLYHLMQRTSNSSGAAPLSADALAPAALVAGQAWVPHLRIQPLVAAVQALCTKERLTLLNDAPPPPPGQPSLISTGVTFHATFTNDAEWREAVAIAMLPMPCASLPASLVQLLVDLTVQQAHALTAAGDMEQARSAFRYCFRWAADHVLLPLTDAHGQHLPAPTSIAALQRLCEEWRTFEETHGDSVDSADAVDDLVRDLSQRNGSYTAFDTQQRYLSAATSAAAAALAHIRKPVEGAEGKGTRGCGAVKGAPPKPPAPVSLREVLGAVSASQAAREEAGDGSDLWELPRAAPPVVPDVPSDAALGLQHTQDLEAPPTSEISTELQHYLAVGPVQLLLTAPAPPPQLLPVGHSAHRRHSKSGSDADGHGHGHGERLRGGGFTNRIPLALQALVPAAPRLFLPRANYFVSVRITSAAVLARMEETQAGILRAAPGLAACRIPTARMHITMAVLSLPGAEAVERACAAFAACDAHVQALFPPQAGPHAVTLRGVGDFNRTVLFAKPYPDAAFARLVELAHRVQTALLQEGLTLEAAHAAARAAHAAAMQDWAATVRARLEPDAAAQVLAAARVSATAATADAGGASGSDGSDSDDADAVAASTASTGPGASAPKTSSESRSFKPHVTLFKLSKAGGVGSGGGRGWSRRNSGGRASGGARGSASGGAGGGAGGQPTDAGEGGAAAASVPAPRKIEPTVWEPYSDANFGQSVLADVQLNAMAGSDVAKGGYYPCVHRLPLRAAAKPATIEV